jgi:glutathione S-transferase
MLFYHSLTSPYSRKVRVVLLEKGIAHESIDVRSSGRRASEHNPLGKVPTVVLDDGTVLFDSVVITETLEALYPKVPLIPSLPLERASVRRWEAIADGICDVVIPVISESMRPVAQQDPAHQAKLLDKARTCLRHIDASLAGRRFLHGDGFTLADIAVVAMSGYLNLRRPELLAEGYLELTRYLNEQLRRKSFAETIPPNLPVMA